MKENNESNRIHRIPNDEINPNPCEINVWIKEMNGNDKSLLDGWKTEKNPLKDVPSRPLKQKLGLGMF